MKAKTKITIGIIAVYLLSIISMTSALVIDNVLTNPNQAEPGDIVNVQIILDNDGENDLTDVSVSLDLTSVPFAPFDSSSEFSFDKIIENKKKTAEFKIIALSEAKSGIYKVPIKIIYKENGDLTQKIKDSLIGIKVNSKPVLGVVLENNWLLKSSENELSVKVINKGLNDIKFLEVEISSSTYINLLSQKNVYIGDLDSDDFDNAKFKLYIKENSPNKIILPVRVIYKDSLNKRYSENFNLELKIYSKERAIKLGLLEKNYTKWYVIGVIVLIIVYFIYRKIKKTRTTHT